MKTSQHRVYLEGWRELADRHMGGNKEGARKNTPIRSSFRGKSPFLS